MIKLVQKSSLLVMFICALLVIQLVGCGEDEDEGEIGASEAPPLPPDESMMVNLSLFTAGTQASPRAATSLTTKNFVNAVIRVATINIGVAVALVSPAALFTVAKTREPVQQSDGSWLWNYSIVIGTVTFTANLTSVTAAGITYWSMKVSTDAPVYPVTDFEWYTGMSEKLNTTGSWQFFDLRTPEEQNPTTKIDWSVAILKEEAELAIENVNTRSQYVGDVLRYNTDLKTASMSFEDASKGEIWEILWNIETGEGSITVPGYNNGEKACWDASKQDVPCN